MDSTELAIDAKKLSVRLGDTLVVQSVSLAVHYGEFGVVAGPNGAGKSTLLRALLGLLSPHEGSIQTAGHALASLDNAERAMTQSYVPQNSALAAALTVEELVGQARFARSESRSKTQEATQRALERVGATALAHRNYLELSGGEKRVALVARALCTEARIVILDEPTACLDIANRLRILALLRSLASDGYAVLAVLHDLDDVAKFADRVTLIHKGRVACTGSPAEVVTAANVRQVYGVELLESAAFGFRLQGEVSP